VINNGEIMSRFAKSVTGNSVTHRTKRITASDEISLPIQLKVTEEPIKPTDRSKAIQA
jgi:hypothetical protein